MAGQKIENKLVNKWRASEGKSLLEMSTGYKTSKDIPALTEINREKIHTALLAAGMTPGLGNIADAADALLYAAEGEFGSAGLSAAAMTPMVGQFVGAKRVLKAAKKAGEEIVTIYRAVGKEGIQASGGKFIGGHKMKGELYATLDHRVAKKYKSINPDRVIMEFEVPKKWLLENEGTIQKATREGDTWYVNFRRKMIESGKSKEVRFSKEVGLPEGFLKKVHK